MRWRCDFDGYYALHDFARARGMADGSRYHVGGIRHALTLLRPESSVASEGDSK